jgi:gamma-glutamyltranspeptidase
MAPSIVVNPNGQVSMVIGSAGGSKITTAIANTLILHYNMKSNASLAELFASKRLHHQMFPNLINFEPGFDQHIIDGLAALNHTMKQVETTIGFGALVGVLMEGDVVSAAFDPRRGGSTAILTEKSRG